MGTSSLRISPINHFERINGRPVEDSCFNSCLRLPVLRQTPI